MTAHTARRFVSLRSLALAGTALTALAVASPAGAAPGTTTTVVNSAADLTNPLDFNGGTLQFNTSLMTNNTATITTLGATINTNGNNVQMTGVISDAVSGMAGALTKTGDGQLYLQGANTYTGGTTVSGGELAGDTTSLQGDIVNNATVAFVQNTDGTYAGNMSGSGSLTKVFAGMLTLSGNNSFFSGGIVLAGGGIAVSAAANLGTGLLNFTANSTLRITGSLTANNAIQASFASPTIEVTGANTATLNGMLSGTGQLTKTGTGTLVLANAGNDFAGAVNLNGGTLSVAADGNLGAAANALNFNGGTLHVTSGAFGGTMRTINWGAAGGGFEIDAGNTFTIGQDLIGGGALVKTGGGSLELNGNNSQNGLTIGGGTVVVSSDAEIGAGDIVLDNGTLQADASFATENAVKLTTNDGTIDTGTFNVTLSGDISDAVSGMAGALTKAGTGTLILTGANTYTGGTTVLGGVLRGDTTSLQGDIANGATVLFVQSADGTYAGDLSGTGELQFSGGGTTLTLTGNNSGSTGATSIIGGTLAISAATNIGTGTIGFFGGGLRITGGVVLNNSISMPAVGNGPIEVTGVNLAVLSGIVSGNGGLDKLGTGELALANANTYMGDTNVMAGRLTVSGSVVGDVNLSAGTFLGGSGMIGGHVSGPGTVSVAQASALDVGSYDATGGTLAVAIDAANPTAPSLIATGAVTLGGGTLSINDELTAQSALMAGMTFTVIQTGAGITGDFGAITDIYAMFDFTGAIVGNDYVITAIGGMTLMGVAQTENQREVAGALGGAGTPPADPDLANVMTQLGMLTEDGVRAGFDALAGEVNADMASPPIANAQLFQGSIFQRLGTLGGAGGQTAYSLGQLALAEAAAQPEVSVAAAAAGAAGPAATGLWVRAHGLFGQVDGDEDGTGAHDLDHSTAGLMAGYDMALSEETIVGIGAGYAHSNLDLDEVDQEGSIHSFRLAAYGATRAGALSLRGLAGYAYHDNSTERHIVIGGFDRTADGDYAGHELSAAGEVGYLMSLGGVALEPVAGLAVTHLSDEGYEESGAGGAGLDVDSRGTTSLRSTLGARATLVETGAVRVGASLAWAHEWADTDRVVDATFAGGGGAFQIQGAEVSRDSALIGAALGLALGGGVDLTIGYDGQFGTDDMAHGLEAVLKLAL